ISAWSCYYWTVELVLVAICVAIAILLRNWLKRPSNYPPGPLGIPGLGVIPFLSTFPQREFLKWSKKYGPMFSARFGLQKWVVLNDYDSVVQTLVKNSQSFHGRPSIRLFIETWTPLGIVFSTGGTIWKTHRNFGTRAVRSINQNSMEETINIEIKEYVARLGEHSGTSVDIHEILIHAVANVFCTFNLGKRFDYDDEKFNLLVKCILNEKHTHPAGFNPTIFRLTFPLCRNKLSKVERSVINEISIAGIVRQVVKDSTDKIETEDKNMMNSYLNKSLSIASSIEGYTTEDTVGFFTDLFIGGTETLTSQLRWGFLTMALHPEYQTRVRCEIDDVIGRNGTAKLSDQSKMPFTRAVIAELLRFRTLGPLSLPRAAVKDVTVQGYKIPKGTNVSSGPSLIVTHEKIWETPHLFIPDRHLDPDGNFVSSKYILPFGAGVRSCLGENLARAELFLVFVATLQNFELSVDENKPPSLDEGRSGIIYTPNPFNLIINQR
uniref:Uncharacterized protein n=1 Tax=Ciona savignyi TaxID=51511 RepID=H2Z815_CIOSA